MRISVTILATAGVLVGGCTGRDPGSESGGSTTEGTGTDGPDVPTEAGTGTTDASEFDGVVAPVIGDYLPLGGSPTPLPTDPLTKNLVSTAIFVGADEFPGVYDGSSRIEFAGVPDGPYMLQQVFAYLTRPNDPPVVTWTETDLRELLMWTDAHSGRPDVATTQDPGTSLAISGTGLQPLTGFDSFELYSYNADVIVFPSPSFDPEDGTQSPEVGATSLDGWTVPWRPSTSRVVWPLIDPGKGDDVWLAHIAGRQLVEAPSGAELTDAWSFAVLSRVAAVAKPTMQAMQGGAANAVDGAFTAVASEQASFDLRVTDFFAALDQSMGASTGTACTLTIFREPGVPVPIVGMTPTLASVSVYSQDLALDPACPPDSCDPDVCDSCASVYAYPGDRVIELEYGDPYAEGQILVQTVCTLTNFLSDPETQASERLRARVAVAGTLAEVMAGPIVPKLGPVRDLRVNGMTAEIDSVTEVTAMPTVSWSPPVIGAPDSYTVSVTAIADSEDLDGNPLQRVLRGWVVTQATSVTIPEGLMDPGSFYYIEVLAQSGHTLGGVVAYTTELADATAITGIVTP